MHLSDHVLTPNHFLIGQMGGDFVPGSVDSEPFNPRKCWRRLQELTRHGWNQWAKEYLPQIGSDRNGTSLTAICRLEMLSSLLMPV